MVVRSVELTAYLSVLRTDVAMVESKVIRWVHLKVDLWELWKG